MIITVNGSASSDLSCSSAAAFAKCHCKSLNPRDVPFPHSPSREITRGSYVNDLLSMRRTISATQAS
ncbi:MAG: hypothetical protein ACK56I_08805, partial [bacterium]